MCPFENINDPHAFFGSVDTNYVGGLTRVFPQIMAMLSRIMNVVGNGME